MLTTRKLNHSRHISGHSLLPVPTIERDPNPDWPVSSRYLFPVTPKLRLLGTMLTRGYQAPAYSLARGLAHVLHG